MERRREQRAKTALGARIRPGSGSEGADCLVSNLSAGGAQLVSAGAAPVPDLFDLVLPGVAEAHAARAVWRRGERTGIAFVEPRAAPPVIDDLPRDR